MTVHMLKTWPIHFEAVNSWKKNFEVRKNDRDFQVGDQLILQEFAPELGVYTGRSIVANVQYILHGGQFGIESGYCVLGLNID